MQVRNICTAVKARMGMGGLQKFITRVGTTEEKNDATNRRFSRVRILVPVYQWGVLFRVQARLLPSIERGGAGQKALVLKRCKDRAPKMKRGSMGQASEGHLA